MQNLVSSPGQGGDGKWGQRRAASPVLVPTSVAELSLSLHAAGVTLPPALYETS